MNLQFVSIVRNILGWFIDLLCKASGVPWTGWCDVWWMWMVSKLKNGETEEENEIVFKVQMDLFNGVATNALTFLQSWNTARPTEITNEKNDNWSALNALIPKMPKPNGTSVMTFNRMKVKIGTATFFNLDFRDSTASVLNLTLKSTSSFFKLRDEMVNLVSPTGRSNETSLRWT